LLGSCFPGYSKRSNYLPSDSYGISHRWRYRDYASCVWRNKKEIRCRSL